MYPRPGARVGRPSNNGRTVRLSSRAFKELQLRASAFKDSPNTVIERLLGIEPDEDSTTIYDLLCTMLTSRGDKATQAKAEIKRRFVAFGWINN